MGPSWLVLPCVLPRLDMNQMSWHESMFRAQLKPLSCYWSLTQTHESEGVAQLKPTQATQVTERVSDASACVRGVALQSVKSTHLLRCWASEASTRGCATVGDSAALCGTQPRHCSRGLPVASVRERHRQHPKGPLVM